MTEAITKTRTTTNTSVVEPGKYSVVIYNDDQTPIEFVIEMLMTVFRHSENSAADLTLRVHHEGHAVAGVYSYEIAEQKGMEGTAMARGQGFPLVLKIETA